MGMEFEWDERKAAGNLEKHKVSFDEARTVFSDPFSITIDDPEHSADEFRFIDIGSSSDGTILVVSYTERTRIRLISARKASKAERKMYEEEKSR